MLPKGVLGRNYYRRLYIYSDSNIHYKKNNENISKNIPLNLASSENWIQVNLEK
jgi:ribosomal protein L13